MATKLSYDSSMYHPGKGTPSSLAAEACDSILNILEARCDTFGVKPNFRFAEPNKFQLLINVKQFKEEEVKVWIVDGFVVVAAKHVEQRDEHGFISRSFTRRYPIPDDVDSDKIGSSLSRDGILTIKAPRKVMVPPVFEGARFVPIQIEQLGMEKEDTKYGLLEGKPVPKVNV